MVARFLVIPNLYLGTVKKKSDLLSRVFRSAIYSKKIRI